LEDLKKHGLRQED
jgi:hypothetical protein